MVYIIGKHLLTKLEPSFPGPFDFEMGLGTRDHSNYTYIRGSKKPAITGNQTQLGLLG